jgi:phosphoribosylglycinamide formyltransferase 1
VLNRLAVLASGRGSNLQALIEAERRGELGARIVLVVANRRSAFALERAASAGIESDVVRRRDFPDRADWDRALADRLRRAEVELVACAGFGLILGPAMLDAFAGRILNVHPSLLPSFGGGLRAPADALAYGVKISGCTVHLVDEQLDAGPIVLQRAVEVRDDDDVEALSARLLLEEHRALPEAVRLLAEGRLRVEGRRVRIMPSEVGVNGR